MHLTARYFHLKKLLSQKLTINPSPQTYHYMIYWAAKNNR
jgi:hypothetical protein